MIIYKLMVKADKYGMWKINEWLTIDILSWCCNASLGYNANRYNVKCKTIIVINTPTIIPIARLKIWMFWYAIILSKVTIIRYKMNLQNNAIIKKATIASNRFCRWLKWNAKVVLNAVVLGYGINTINLYNRFVKLTGNPQWYNRCTQMYHR